MMGDNAFGLKTRANKVKGDKITGVTPLNAIATKTQQIDPNIAELLSLKQPFVATSSFLIALKNCSAVSPADTPYLLFVVI
uniref:Transposase n=1 Tax=Panagrellus redivivus TaxID=6233 RepID=A0A7E4WB49_PANRE